MKNMKDERNLSALADVRNIIAQEIYKISIVKQYPEEYLRIIELYQTISKKTDSAGIDNESETLYRFKRELVNCVVEKKSASEYKANLIDLIDKITEENFYSEKDTAKELKRITSEIFKSNRNFKTSINYMYPPELLLEWGRYIDLFDYYYNKSYEFKNTRRKVTDDSSFAEKGEYIQVMSSFRTPVTIVRPYGKKLIEMSKKTETIEVPSNAYSKDLTPRDFYIENPLDMKKAEIMRITNYKDISDVELTTELTFSVNELESISQDDLELIIINIRSCISYEKHYNYQLLKITASTDEEINHAFDFEELSVPSYVERDLIMSAKKSEIPDFRAALKFLAGLSLMQKTSLLFHKSTGHYTWNKRKSIVISSEVDNLRLEINKEIVAKYINKKSEDEIKTNYINEGYKKVLDGVNRHLELFQHKRVQFDCTLNSEQRLALKSAPEINFDDLHYDDIERTKKKIGVHKKQGRDASVRIRKNGSYVITW